MWGNPEVGVGDNFVGSYSVPSRGDEHGGRRVGRGDVRAAGSSRERRRADESEEPSMPELAPFPVASSKSRCCATYTYVYMNVYVCIHIYIYIHVCVTYTYACTYTYTHTHTCQRATEDVAGVRPRNDGGSPESVHGPQCVRGHGARGDCSVLYRMLLHCVVMVCDHIVFYASLLYWFGGRTRKVPLAAACVRRRSRRDGGVDAQSPLRSVFIRPRTRRAPRLCSGCLRRSTSAWLEASYRPRGRSRARLSTQMLGKLLTCGRVAFWMLAGAESIQVKQTFSRRGATQHEKGDTWWRCTHAHLKVALSFL